MISYEAGRGHRQIRGNFLICNTHICMHSTLPDSNSARRLHMNAMVLGHFFHVSKVSNVFSAQRQA